MATQVRSATDADVEALIGLTRRTISASYRPVLGDAMVDAFIDSGAADEYVRQNVAQCSVIVSDGALMGYAVCREDLIDLMMIDVAYQRRGLGSILLKHMEGALFQKHDALTLESFEGNTSANHFYCKHGWHEVRTYFDKDSGVNKVVFRKVASPKG
jgi:ribosomal protein S18 acetylase RimI-like enzyme